MDSCGFVWTDASGLPNVRDCIERVTTWWRCGRLFNLLIEQFPARVVHQPKERRLCENLSVYFDLMLVMYGSRNPGYWLLVAFVCSARYSAISYKLSVVIDQSSSSSMSSCYPTGEADDPANFAAVHARICIDSIESYNAQKNPTGRPYEQRVLA